MNDFAAESGRHIHLVLENDDNAAQFLAPAADAGNGFYRAQWNDDYHHAWHVLLTGERQGYYRDYQDAGTRIARTLAQGFAYQGEASAFRGGKGPAASRAHRLPRADFVNFVQNHDQIGNRPMGERLSILAKPEALAAALAVLLLQPGPPLMFMGDEWGADEPFPFFCDFKGELAQAVRNGRRREFAEAYALHGDEIPDPLAGSDARCRRARLGRARKARAGRAAGADPRAAGRAASLRRAADPGDDRRPAKSASSPACSRRAGRAGEKSLLLLANLSDAPSQTGRCMGRPIWGDHRRPTCRPGRSMRRSIHSHSGRERREQTRNPEQMRSSHLDSGLALRAVPE